jgi:hypothetical protein
MAQLGAAQAVAEAIRQGAARRDADARPPRGRARARAPARSSSSSRSRSRRPRRRRPSSSRRRRSTPADVADAGRDDYLDELSDAYLADQLGGALSAAQNAGRLAAMGHNQASRFYASELLDTNTCTPCEEIDGTEYDVRDEAAARLPGRRVPRLPGRPPLPRHVVAVYDEAEAVGMTVSRRDADARDDPERRARLRRRVETPRPARGRSPKDDLARDDRALDDPASRAPAPDRAHRRRTSRPARVAGGFEDQPAFGRFTNLRLARQRQTIVADAVGVPVWLAEILPAAFPSRSIEVYSNVKTATGQDPRRDHERRAARRVDAGGRDARRPPARVRRRDARRRRASVQGTAVSLASRGEPCPQRVSASVTYRTCAAASTRSSRPTSRAATGGGSATS